MFVHWPGKLNLGVTVDQVVAVIESINSPNISVSDVGTEPTKAFIVGVRNHTGTFTVFCYLLQTDSMRPIIYHSDPPEVGLDDYPVLEGEAIQFAESMGFMLDNMNFRARPPEEMMALAEQLPFFRDPAPPRRNTLEQLEELPALPAGLDAKLVSVLQAHAQAAVAGRAGTPAAGLPHLGAGAARAPAASPHEVAALARLLASF